MKKVIYKLTISCRELRVLSTDISLEAFPYNRDLHVFFCIKAIIYSEKHAAASSLL